MPVISSTLRASRSITARTCASASFCAAPIPSRCPCAYAACSFWSASAWGWRGFVARRLSCASAPGSVGDGKIASDGERGGGESAAGQLIGSRFIEASQCTLDDILLTDRALQAEHALGFELAHDRDDLLL